MSRKLLPYLLNLLIFAVAGHSIIAGLALLFAPLRVLGLFGWEYAGPAFWPSQAGLFLFILGAAYMAALGLRPLVWLIILSKACAFIFLVSSIFLLEAPRIVLLLAVGDGLMGLAVATVFWWQKRAATQPDIEAGSVQPRARSGILEG